MKEYSGSRVLITGGLGFIGSNLAHALLKEGAKVTIVDSLSSKGGGNRRNVADMEGEAEVVVKDVRDVSLMKTLVKDKEYIFNLVGQISHVESIRDPLSDFDANCTAPLSVLEACRQANDGVPILYAATRAQYGRVAKLPVAEDSAMNPTDVNGVNKICGEAYHLLYSRVYGMKATSLRISNTYGPRQCVKRPDFGFAGWFIRLAMEGKPMKVYGDGTQRRDFNYVDDVVGAHLMTLCNKRAYGEVFNLGGSPSNILSLAKKIIGVVRKGSYEFVPYPEDYERIEFGDYEADISKIQRAIGWAPKVALEEGIKRTVEFYEKNKEYYW